MSEPVLLGSTVVAFLQALEFVTLPVALIWHLALAAALAVIGTWVTRMQTVPHAKGPAPPIRVEIVSVVRMRDDDAER